MKRLLFALAILPFVVACGSVRAPVRSVPTLASASLGGVSILPTGESRRVDQVLESRVLEVGLVVTPAYAQRIVIRNSNDPDNPAPTECSLADGHDHEAMAAIGCKPDSSNTGVPAGYTQTAYTGSTTLNTPTTIDGKIFEGGDCPITFNSGAVGSLITNSTFNCDGRAITVDDQGTYSATSAGTVPIVTIKDSDINGGFSAPGSHCLAEAHIKIVRVEVVGCENGFDVNQNITIEDSFVHAIYEADAGAHGDALQCAPARWNGSAFVPGCKNLTIMHSTVIGRGDLDDTGSATSALIMNKDGDQSENVLIQHSFLGGGGHTVYCNRNDGGPNYPGINVQIIDNWFLEAYPSVDTRTNACSDETDVSGNKLFPSGTPITLN